MLWDLLAVNWSKGHGGNSPTTISTNKLGKVADDVSQQRTNLFRVDPQD